MHFFSPFSNLGLPEFDNHLGMPLMNVFHLNIRKLSNLQSTWNRLLHLQGSKQLDNEEGTEKKNILIWLWDFFSKPQFPLTIVICF